MALSYILRVPVRTLGTQPVTGLENLERHSINGVDVTLSSSPPFLIAKAEGFSSVAEAMEYVPRIAAGFWALAIRWNIAFRPTFSPKVVKYFDDPATAGSNIARTFGHSSGEPVDAIVDAADTVIFESGRRILTMGAGEATATVHTPVQLALPTFVEGVADARASQALEDHLMKTVLELYNSYFYELSIRAKFLTLMTILEVLAPEREKHETAQSLIREFKDRVTAVLADSDDLDTIHALESLNRELDFRMDTSIRQRLRYLVRDEFADEDSAVRTRIEVEVVEAYDLRGTLTHTGVVPDDVLSAINDRTWLLVRRMLGRRLHVRGSDNHTFRSEI